MAPVVAKKLQSGFRKEGLSTFNPQELLKNLPGYRTAEEERSDIGQALDESLVKLLQDNRGHSISNKAETWQKNSAGHCHHC
ncbi:hypothetical protein HOLleu_16808 [Holothuria leucospilota]|uniref:Uncharacterized protein n=1 Tax=Holothuria leucospilota TaxID=206669 RepID=A0A9Q1C6S1_HOLLE|nr:hypothetical protein HOLleu_16808 [Holothuria leucospilota]